MTKVFQSASNLPIENVSDKIGWMSINGHTVYYIGIDSYYKGYELPDMSYSNRRTVFLQGFSFLQVGNFNNEVFILWLVAHIAYSLYWFDKAGVKFRSLLFLKGETNLFKSAIAEVITNVFKVDRTQSSKRLNSTRASLQEYLSKSPDNFVLIDDLSNSVGANNKKMIENAEFVIRAIGDGQFPGKMSISDRSKIKDIQVRCTVVATGEEAFGLSTSSEYRMITLNVVKGTFNPQILSQYQDDPTMLRDYYALYIQFLQNCGTRIVELCKSRLPQYRNYFRNLSVPRFIDAAVALSLQVDTLQEFARYCGACEEAVQKTLQSCHGVILDVLQRNQASTVTGKPEVRFIKALMQSIGTDKCNGLADNEEVYAKDESNFIGFRDTDNNQIWLRFVDSINLVKKYYWQLGEQFLTKETTLKDTLVRQGIAVGKINENGVNQYLMRAKKGSRKYLLVLNMPKVYEILEGDGF